MRRVPILWSAIVLVVAAALWRLAGTHVAQHPALVTPQMDVHREVSGALDARVYRLLHPEGGGDRSARPKLIALTFDDGPYPLYTPLLLDELRDLHVPATFFLIGRDAEQWPELTRRIHTEGHELANHTYSHPNLDMETDAQVTDELRHGDRALAAIAPDPSEHALMRPPHGRYTEATLRVAQALHYQVVLWTYDTGDWKQMTTAQIESGVLDHATAPDIVLMHSGKAATIEALPAIVSRFRAAGYQFVTVGTLLSLSTPAEINHPARGAV